MDKYRSSFFLENLREKYIASYSEFCELTFECRGREIVKTNKNKHFMVKCNIILVKILLAILMRFRNLKITRGKRKIILTMKIHRKQVG